MGEGGVMGVWYNNLNNYHYLLLFGVKCVYIYFVRQYFIYNL